MTLLCDRRSRKPATGRPVSLDDHVAGRLVPRRAASSSAVTRTTTISDQFGAGRLPGCQCPSRLSIRGDGLRRSTAPAMNMTLAGRTSASSSPVSGLQRYPVTRGSRSWSVDSSDEEMCRHWAYLRCLCRAQHAWRRIRPFDQCKAVAFEKAPGLFGQQEHAPNAEVMCAIHQMVEHRAANASSSPWWENNHGAQ